MSAVDAGVPGGDLESAWRRRLDEMSLVGPNRRREFTVAVVGSGLAGAAAAASLSELGYRVLCFCFQDSPRRAHSVAAQGGINAAKNYQNDGDSTWRLFADTLKGGDFRSREANVYRLAELSVRIIDHCAAQGIPFAREYGGLLANRSFGGALVSRTFYARGQTGQQLLLGAYQALSKEIAHGTLTMLPRREMLELVTSDGRARGIVARHLETGALETWTCDAVVLATGGYSNVFHLSTNAVGSNATAIWRAYRSGAAMANPCFVQFHPTCLPASGEGQAKLTLMSESLRNDGRVWVPRRADDGRAPAEIPEEDRDYYLERLYPRYGNLAPRDLASRAAKRLCDEGRGVGATGRAVYLDLRDAAARVGEGVLGERYGNLFEMYALATGDDPLRAPMRIYPAAHYSMGGLWVDYDLMTTVPGLFAIGEANFSDHGANRLGASALMQTLADGYFIVPNTVGNYLANARLRPIAGTSDDATDASARAAERLAGLVSIRGTRSARSFHQELGEILWNHCGLSRHRAGLTGALVRIRRLREAFWSDLRVVGGTLELNQELERAGRVADFIELGELMCEDALAREESCGCHFREEHQTPAGEAAREDAGFAHVALWRPGVGSASTRPERGAEPLHFQAMTPTTRSYQ